MSKFRLPTCSYIFTMSYSPASPTPFLFPLNVCVILPSPYHLDAYVDGELLALWALDAMLITVLVTKERGGGEYIPTVDIDMHLRLLHRCLASLNPSPSWMLR
jgi:hypothetical protein